MKGLVKKLLVGDVGGTNTVLGIYDSNNNSLGRIKKLRTIDLKIESEISNFLEDEKIEGVSLAVAGPVKNGFVKMTNVSKNFSSRGLSKKTGLDVLLLNDFEALGFYAKKRGESKALVVGAGTGLGKVFVLDNVHCSECAHQLFPFLNSEEKLKDFFFKKLKRFPEYDDLVSGKGLVLLKQFHAKKNLSLEEKSPKNIFLESDASSKKAVKDFSKFYGRFIKNSYVDFLPDKIFIAGGIARKHPSILKSEGFSEELVHRFFKKPKISLLKDEYAPLFGAGFAFFHKNI